MIKPIDFTDQHIIGFQMQGKITEDEIKAWADKLDQKSDQAGKLRVYVEAKDIDSVTMDAVLEDLKFDITHLGDFEKAAFVSDETWTKLSAFMGRLVPNLEARQFALAEREQAQQWIKS